MRKFYLFLSLMIMGCIPQLFAGESVPFYDPCNSPNAEIVQDVPGTTNSRYMWQRNTPGIYKYDQYYKVQRRSSSYAHNATVFTSEIDFQAGKCYRVKVRVTGQSAHGAAFKVNLATGVKQNTFDGAPLMQYDNLERDTWQEFIAYFSPTEDMTRRIAVTDISPKTLQWFKLQGIWVDEVSAMAPEAPTGLTVTAASNGELKASVRVKAPSTTVDGKPLTKLDALNIYYHASLLHSVKNVQPGETVNVTFPLTMNGEYRMHVVAVANGLESERVMDNVGEYIGSEVPYYNEGKNNEYDYKGGGWRIVYQAAYVPGQGVKLTYDSILADKNGAITYSAVRMPDNKKLFENKASANFVDASFLTDAEDNTYYWYEVTESNGTVRKSNSIALNSPLPYNFTLDSWIGFNKRNDRNLTSFDTRKTRSVWSSGSTSNRSHSQVSSSDSKGAVCVTPGVKLEAGKTYRFDINVSTGFDGVAVFNVAYGKGSTPADLTNVIIPYTEIAYNQEFHLHTGFFVPTETDNYFFGIKAFDPTDEENRQSVLFDRIRIEEVAADMPSAVEGLKIEFKSALEGVLKFTTAANNVSGKPQQELDRVEIYKNDVLFHTLSGVAPGTAYEVEAPITPKQTDVYTVYAINSLGKSLGSSVSIFLQAPPFLYPFDNSDEFKGWTVVDGYRDGYTWSHQGSELRAFNSDGELSEWTFTPPVYLEAGKYYKVRFAGCTGRETLLLSAYLGEEPAILEMDKEILAPASVEPYNYNRFFTDYITVPETKTYYFGFHAEDTIHRKSSASNYHVYIDDFQVTEGQPGTIPGEGQMIITPASDGTAKATITLKQPTTDLEGNPLKKPCTKAYIYFKSISSSITSDVKDWVLPADLKKTVDLTSTDDVTVEITSGFSNNYYHIFKVEFENEDGVGAPSEQIMYIGTNYPDLPGNFTAKISEKGDSVYFSWNTPRLDENGYPLNCARVIYDLKYRNFNPYKYMQSQIGYNSSASSIRGNYADTTYNYSIYAPTQRFLRFELTPKACPNKNNTSSMKTGRYIAVTPMMSVGPAYELPYSESWPNCRGDKIYRAEAVNGMGAYGFDTSALTATPYDNDAGMAIMQFAYLEDALGLISGRINLSISKPVLRFALYNFGDADRTDVNTLQIQVRRQGMPWEVVDEKTIDEWTKGQKQNWSIVNVDLSAYAGEVVETAFVGICNRITFIAIDHVSIGEPNAIDLTAANFTLPEEGYVGSPLTPFTLTVKNNGSEKAENVTAALYRNGVKVSADIAIGDIESDELATCEFTDSLTLADLEANDEIKYYAVVSVANDADESDNKSAEKTLPLINPDTYPRVQALTGAAETETVRLNWTKPTVPTEPEAITDDFESYPSWSDLTTGMGFYTFYDQDNMSIVDLEYVYGCEWPIKSYSKQAFVLANFSDYCFQVFHENYPGYLEARSGEKCLVSIQNSDSFDWPVCDWVISPKLPGIKQTISVYAKGMGNSTESLEVFYTTRDSKSIRNFEALDNVIGIPAREWTKYEFELPDSAVRFGIRHYRAGGFMLMLDDMEYTPLGNERLKLEAYNVYRNGELIARNFKPADINAEQVEFVDQRPADGDYDYEVTAVYNRGESSPELASVNVNGLTSLSTKAAAAYGLTGKIAVKGAQGKSVEVYTVDGVLLTAAEGRDEMQIAAPAGFYLVTIGSEAFKITVK